MPERPPFFVLFSGVILILCLGFLLGFGAGWPALRACEAQHKEALQALHMADTLIEDLKNKPWVCAYGYMEVSGVETFTLERFMELCR